MGLDIVNALIQAGIGALALIVIFTLIYTFPRNAEAIRGIVDQIRQTTEAGIERVEGANGVLTESIRLLQEVNRASIASRERLESKYDEVASELKVVKADFEARLAAKDAEIAALKRELEALRTSSEQKVRDLTDKLVTTIKERDELLRRIEILEKAQKPAEGSVNEKAA